MANIKANAKSAQRAKKDRQIHKTEKSFLKNRIKEARLTGTAEALNTVFKALDSKAAKGLIKKEKANRLKSRLVKNANKINSPKEAE